MQGVCQKRSGGMVIVLFQNEDMGPPCQSKTPKEVNLAVHQWDVNNVEGTYPSYQKMNKIIIFFSWVGEYLQRMTILHWFETE